jgi:RNA polymerase sigma-70 factor (ECF subfamily)
MSQQVRLDRFEEWFILRKARQLAGKAGFTTDDVEDIEQDIRLDVLQRLPRFDPAKSNRHTFIAMVVRRCAATILERQRAEKRNRGRRPQSLNALIRDADGREVDFYQTLAGNAHQPGRREEELRDLIADVRRVVASLPDYLRPWCDVFGELGIRETSRELHVPRCRLQRIKAEIRAAFEEAGLEDYLPET